MTVPELEAIAAAVRVAESRGLPVLLIGALAREIVFDHQYEGKSYRATTDVDISVRVADWAEYHDLVDTLVKQADFTRIGEHKLQYKDGTEVDLLPYGGVADENKTIPWMGGDRVMSVAGFEAAAAHGEPHTIAGVQIRVANLPGLIALKFFALPDRILDRRATDLPDLNYILSNASDALRNRIYDELGHHLFEELDYQGLGPYLLGRDVARILEAGEVTRLLVIIDTHVLTPPDYAALSRIVLSSDIDAAIARLTSFRRGLIESCDDNTRNTGS